MQHICAYCYFDFFHIVFSEPIRILLVINVIQSLVLCLQTQPKKPESVHQGKQKVGIFWSFPAPLSATYYCPLLLYFSSSALSLPIIYSILSDGPGKTLPEDEVPLHVSLPSEKLKLNYSAPSQVVVFLECWAWHGLVRAALWQPLTPTVQARCLNCSHYKCACDMEWEGERSEIQCRLELIKRLDWITLHWWVGSWWLRESVWINRSTSCWRSRTETYMCIPDQRKATSISRHVIIQECCYRTDFLSGLGCLCKKIITIISRMLSCESAASKHNYRSQPQKSFCSSNVLLSSHPPDLLVKCQQITFPLLSSARPEMLTRCDWSSSNYFAIFYGHPAGVGTLAFQFSL